MDPVGNLGFLIRARFPVLNADDVLIIMAVHKNSDGEMTASKIAVMVHESVSKIFVTIVSVHITQPVLMEEWRTRSTQWCSELMED